MKQQVAYVGNCSKNGIYQYKYKNGTLKKIANTNDFERCTYLANTKSYLYTVREVQDKKNQNNGYVVAYQKQEGRLIKIDQQSSYGKAPCHIAINEKTKKMFISNYIDGTFVIFKINDNGKIGDKIYSNQENEKKSHMHYAKMFQNDQYLITVDLGEDTIIVYEIKDDKIEEVSRIKFKENTQPRHIAIKDQKIYVVTEATCELYTLKFENKQLKIIDVISILPPNVKLRKSFTGCAIKISKDLRYLYVTIRGYNGISIYKIEKEKLTYLQNISCEGDLPRDLEIAPSGKYVLVANQGSNEIAIFRRNTITGKLSYQNKERVEAPTCIIIE